MKRIIIFATVSAVVWTAESLWLSARQPEISQALALQQVNGGTDAARRLREFESLKDSVHVLVGTLLVLAAIGCFNASLRKGLAHFWQRLSQARLHGLLVLASSISL